jgi:prophage regulatory protein
MKRILRWRELKEKVPLTRQHLLRLEKADKFPKRLRLGKNSVGWLEEEVDGWVDEQAAARSAIKPSRQEP